MAPVLPELQNPIRPPAGLEPSSRQPAANAAKVRVSGNDFPPAGNSVQDWIRYLADLTKDGAGLVRLHMGAHSTNNPHTLAGTVGGAVVLPALDGGLLVFEVSSGGAADVVTLDVGTFRALRQATARNVTGILLYSDASGHIIAQSPAGEIFIVEVWLVRGTSSVRAVLEHLLPTVSEADAEAGTSQLRRAWSPERVKQAIAALASQSGGRAGYSFFEKWDETTTPAFKLTEVSTSTTVAVDADYTEELLDAGTQRLRPGDPLSIDYEGELEISPTVTFNVGMSVGYRLWEGEDKQVTIWREVFFSLQQNRESSKTADAFSLVTPFGVGTVLLKDDGQPYTVTAQDFRDGFPAKILFRLRGYNRNNFTQRAAATFVHLKWAHVGVSVSQIGRVAQDPLGDALEERQLADLEDRTRAIGYEGSHAWVDTTDDDIKLAAITSDADIAAGYAGLDYDTMPTRSVTLTADVADLGLAFVLPAGQGPAGLRIQVLRDGAVRYTLPLSHWKHPSSPPAVDNLPDGARFYWYAPAGAGPAPIGLLRDGDILSLQAATHTPVWNGAIRRQDTPRSVFLATSGAERRLMMGSGSNLDYIGTSPSTFRDIRHVHDVATVRFSGHLTGDVLEGTLILAQDIYGQAVPDNLFFELRDGALVPTSNGTDTLNSDFHAYMGNQSRMWYYEDLEHALISDTSKTHTLTVPSEHVDENITRVSRGQPFVVIFDLPDYNIAADAFSGRVIVQENAGAEMDTWDGKYQVTFDRVGAGTNRFSLTPGSVPDGADAAALTVGKMFPAGSVFYNVDDTANASHVNVNGDVGFTVPYLENLQRRISIHLEAAVEPAA